jgi:hypothetical protein
MHIMTTAQFLHLETCGLRKWGKTKEKVGAGYEPSTCFMARDVSEKYLYQIRQSLEYCDLAQSL